MTATDHRCREVLHDGRIPIEELRLIVARIFPHANEAQRREHVVAGVRVTLDDYDAIRYAMAGVLRWHEDARNALDGIRD
jgi:hypothetical protein